MTSQEWRQRAGGNWMPVNLGEIRSIAQSMLERGARFEAFVVTQTKAGELRLIWHWDLKGKLFSVESRAAVAFTLIFPYASCAWIAGSQSDCIWVSSDGKVDLIVGAFA